MKLHSVFLRNECLLPDHFSANRASFGQSWMIVKEITGPVFDTMIRQEGWHFIWICGFCSRRGWGRTQEEAIDRGLARALCAMDKQCNAAQFDSVQVTKFPGFCVANVSLQRGQVQECVLLNGAD